MFSEEKNVQKKSERAGMRAYRFIIMHSQVPPSTDYRGYQNDEDGGVSLTTNEKSYPKSQPALGKYKLTFSLKNDTDIVILSTKNKFSSYLNENPKSLCYTKQENELKCKAEHLLEFFTCIKAEEHFPHIAPASTVVDSDGEEWGEEW